MTDGVARSARRRACRECHGRMVGGIGGLPTFRLARPTPCPPVPAVQEKAGRAARLPAANRRCRRAGPTARCYVSPPRAGAAQYMPRARYVLSPSSCHRHVDRSSEPNGIAHWQVRCRPSSFYVATNQKATPRLQAFLENW